MKNDSKTNEELVKELAESCQWIVGLKEEEIKDMQVQEPVQHGCRTGESPLENIPDIIARFNRHMQFVYVNPAIRTLTGLEPCRVIGRSIHDVGLSRELARRFEESARKVFESRCEQSAECRHLTPHGPRFLYIRMLPELSEASRVETVLSIASDITGRKQREDVLRTSEKQLKFLFSRLQTVQENERERLAQALHDSIGQTLAAIKFRVECALSALSTDRGESAQKCLESLVPIIQDAIEEVRNIYTDLRPSILNDFGLIEAIGWLLRQFHMIYPEVRIEKEIRIEESDIPSSLKISIFRILQECLSNIARHKVRSIHLSLTKVNGLLELNIKDTGRDDSEAGPREDSEGDLAFASMRERAEHLGGSIEVRLVAGKENIVRAIWPLYQN